MAVTVAGKDSKQLMEERASLILKAQDYHKEHGDNWAQEHENAFNAMMADAETLHAAAKRHSTLEGLIGGDGASAAGSGHIDPMAGHGRRGGDGEQRMIQIRSGQDASGKPRYVEVPCTARGQAAYEKAFADFLRTGKPSAALQSDDAEQAGYLLASEQFAAGILKAVDDLLFVRQHARIHTVPQAESLGIRKRTSKANTFDWSSELTVSAEDESLKYGKKVLHPHHLTGRIRVSRDLLRRSVVSVEGEVRSELARDAGETMEDAYFYGNGDRKPLGVFVASTDGISTTRDVNTGSATGFTPDGILSAKYKLKQQYRNGGARSGARWLFHRDAIALIAKLKDGDDHYLLHPGRGLTGDEWDTLVGYPVDESERAPNTFSNGNYGGLLANWSYYEIADALDMEIQVLYELYATTNQVGYIGRLKTDGMPTLEEAFVRLKCAT